MQTKITMERLSSGSKTIWTGVLESSTRHIMQVEFPGVGGANTFRSRGDGVWIDEIGVEWRVVDGNDNLYVLISDAADKLVDLMREAETRGLKLGDRPMQVYGDVLALSETVTNALREGK